MLKQRVITALLLMAVLLPAVLASSPWPFVLFVLVMVGAAGWEWARLNALDGFATWGFGAATAAGVAAWVAGGGLERAQAVAVDGAARVSPLWWLAVLAWLAYGATVLRMGPTGWPRLPQGLRLLVGLVGIAVAGCAMLSAHRLGLNFLLSAMAIVWVADIAAYFTGRAFGRRKLAPSISPGKSVEGALGGLFFALLLAQAWPMVDLHLPWLTGQSLFGWLRGQGGAIAVSIGTAVLVALSIVGDLTESAVKRAAGAKDSSRLLPGHGGVLDRIDALLPVIPAAMALAAGWSLT